MVKLTPLFSAGQDDHEAPKTLKVVIAYDKISACRRAMSMLTRLLEQDTEAMRILPALWPLDSLHHPDRREQVMEGAVSADLLILSTSEAGVIPSAIESLVWAFLCLQPRTTILALLGYHADWRIFIHEIADDPLDSRSPVESIPSAALRQLRFHAPIAP